MAETKKTATDCPIVLLESAGAWDAWLERHHDSVPCVWLHLAKKGSTVKAVTYPEAVEIALCHGWIDGQTKSFDEQTFIQRFSPRRPTSLWSKINVEKAERLIAEGHMRPWGMKVIEIAKERGSWDAAYHGSRNSQVPEDLAAALARQPRARRFFESLDNVNRYAVLWRIQTARRPETREKRIATIVDMLLRGETYHPRSDVRGSEKDLPVKEQVTTMPKRPRTKTHVAFLRAVNVGGKSVAMAELRAMTEALGFERVRTVLQSGNLILDDTSRRDSRSIAAALGAESARTLGSEILFIVRTADQVRKIVESNPFVEAARADPAHTVAMILDGKPGRSDVEALRTSIVGNESIELVGDCLYLTYPDGIGRSRLTNTLIEKKLGVRGTARNWNTMLKILTAVASEA